MFDNAPQVVKDFAPGTVIRSPKPVKRGAYDYAQIMAVMADDKGNGFSVLIGSVGLGVTVMQSRTFRNRFGDYALPSGQTVAQMLPLGSKTAKTAQQLMAAV
tara:strand:+ start:358 stop:663 length:306 start_codon:yes stop_codon:yes gene_type:complete